jgi:hypothetical protein
MATTTSSSTTPSAPAAPPRPAAANPPVVQSKPPLAPRVYDDPSAVYREMEKAMAHVNLLAPIVKIDFIPPAHGVSLRSVFVNPDPKGGEVYPLIGGGGKLALTAAALDRISAAAEVSWFPYPVSKRLDDGKTRNYVNFLAVGCYRTFSGSWRPISAEKEIDMRDGGGEFEAIVEAKVKKVNDDRREARQEPLVGEALRQAAILAAWGQIVQVRQHLQSHAETKARHRALRKSLTIKQGYTTEDLAKPFLVPVLVLTGKTNDPALRMMVMKEMARNFRTGAGQMFQMFAQVNGGATSSAPPVPGPVPFTDATGDPDYDDDDRYDPDPSRIFSAVPGNFVSDDEPAGPPSAEEMARADREFAVESASAPPPDDDRPPPDDDAPFDPGPRPGPAPASSAGRGAWTRGGGGGVTMGFDLTGKQTKGKTPDELEPDEVLSFIKLCRRTLADDTKKQYHPKDKQRLEALLESAKRRGIVVPS